MHKLQLRGQAALCACIQLEATRAALGASGVRPPRRGERGPAAAVTPPAAASAQRRGNAAPWRQRAAAAPRGGYPAGTPLPAERCARGCPAYRISGRTGTIGI